LLRKVLNMASKLLGIPRKGLYNKFITPDASVKLQKSYQTLCICIYINIDTDLKDY